MDRANEIFPAENEDEDTEATIGGGVRWCVYSWLEVARSVFVFVSSSTLVSDCLIKYISIVCCFVVAMPSVKRETERKVNAPVDTGPSPNSDGSDGRSERARPGERLLSGMVDFRTNFHRLILLVVELAILLDLRAVVLLSGVISNAISRAATSTVKNSQQQQQ
ncbi:hypothetical protein T06_8996 [Trichinella sp. T6]|nr:hypothetical protein T06_8996 [Trichinella sp. T6]